MAQQRQLATPTYLVGFALICIPPFDALMQVMPPRIHDPRWRFGAFGLFSNAFMIPLVGLLIVYLGTMLFEHRTFQKVLGVFSLVVAVATVAFLGLFALDLLQVRNGVNPAAQLAFKVASSTAVLKSLLGALTLGAFSWASFRAPRLPKTASTRSGSPLIIGGKGASKSGAALPQAPTTDVAPATAR